MSFGIDINFLQFLFCNNFMARYINLITIGSMTIYVYVVQLYGNEKYITLTFVIFAN